MSEAVAKSGKKGQRPTLWFLFQWLCWNLIVLLSALATFYAATVLAGHNWLSNEAWATPIIPSLPIVSNTLQLGHILTALPCLVLGPWLFFEGFRNRWLRVHRLLGKTYVMGVWISAVLGFILAVFNHYGIWARLGFSCLAIVWFTTTLMAYRHIKAGNQVLHRRWMIRSYSLSLAVVTVRFLSPPGDMPMEIWYPILTWLCWVPNLAIGEVYARITKHSGALIWAGKKRDPDPAAA